MRELVWLNSVEILGPEFHTLVTSDISHYKHYLMVALDIFLTIFIRERYRKSDQNTCRRKVIFQVWLHSRNPVSSIVQTICEVPSSPKFYVYRLSLAITKSQQRLSTEVASKLRNYQFSA
jgi:hypothetical protein